MTRNKTKSKKKQLKKHFLFIDLGGCATFGHSCYGGMGKRMSSSDLLTNEEVLQDVQQEGNPADIVFTGPRGDVDMEPERKITLQQLYNLSPFLRQWVITNLLML